MVACISFMIICSVLYGLDMSLWHTEYITIVSAVLFVAFSIALTILEERQEDKIRGLERRISELENRTTLKKKPDFANHTGGDYPN